MGITLTNNAHTTLSADASSTDTTFYVEDIDSFPTLDVGDYFYCTIERTSGAMEIVKVTQINSSSFIVERGQENTIPISFPIGSLVSLKMTVQNITDLILTGSNINDDAYDSSWNGDTNDAPSRNAVYDKFVTVDAALAGYTAADVLAKLLTVDGTGSGLDADLLDGLSSAAYAQLSGAAFTGGISGTTASFSGASSFTSGALTVGFNKQTGDSAITLASDDNFGDSTSIIWTANGTTKWYLRHSASNGSLFLRNNSLGTSAVSFALASNNATFTGTVSVPDDAYAAGWDGNLTVPTKNAVYDKIEGLSSLYQPLDADLTTWAGLTPSANAQSLVTAADYSAMRTLLGLVPGTDVQAYSSVLATLASEIITSASSTIYLGKQTGASNHYWGIKIDNTAPALGGFVWNLEGVDQWRLNMNYAGTMFLYNPVLASSVYTISPSTNVMAFAVTPTVQDDAYAAGWDGNLTVPTKNAVYDKIQSLGVLSDGDKGDITVSASGATWTIDNNTVTLAKMATMATDSILGRATASTGNVEVLTALPFAFTGDVTRAADSNAQTIANSAVTLAKMANLNQYELIGRSTAGAGAPEAKATSANVWTMLGSADNATIRSNIGLAIGTNVQAYSAILAALAASSNITGTITVSTSAPSGGSSGDVWYERAA